MDGRVSIVLVGIGGYGNFYVDNLLNADYHDAFTIAGVVDYKPESCPRISEIRERNIPVCHTVEEFYAGNTADLAIISTPIHYHCRHTCYALAHGSNVLCEKPAAATLQEVEMMIEARDKAGKFVSIGYQWSHSEAVLSLKRDIMSGVLGRPLRFKTIVLWPRTDSYFKRGWAGRKYDDNGSPIFDSIAHNAAAHYLHNMLYVLGDRVDASAKPSFVTAELYRANNIENFDTIAMRIDLENETEALFIGTHATNELLGPDFVYEFENAYVTYKNEGDDAEREIKAVFKDGSAKCYGDPYLNQNSKILTAIKAVREGTPIPCGLEASAAQVMTIGGAQQSTVDIGTFPEQLVHHDENMFANQSGIWVEGLSNALKACYKSRMLPDEMAISWAKPAKRIDMKTLSR